jgi:1,2-phenylacetyl-CoA epoxidase PaaB subunit
VSTPLPPPANGRILYDVYGREKPGGPVTHLGTLEAPDEDLAGLYASQLFARRGECHGLHVEARAKQQSAPSYERVLEHHSLRSASSQSPQKRASKQAENRDEGKKGHAHL